MSSMGAAVAAAGAAGASGAAGMAGMGSMDTPGGASSFVIARLFDRLGLDALNHLSNAIAQPLLVALLTISLVASCLAYRGHRRLYIPVLTLASSVAMYVSIYVWMSEPLYFVSLGGLLAAGVWSIFLTRKPSGWSESRIQESAT